MGALSQLRGGFRPRLGLVKNLSGFPIVFCTDAGVFSVVFVMVLRVILISCPVFSSVLQDAVFFPSSSNIFLCLGWNKHDG